MNVSRTKPADEILSLLDGEKRVFVLGCGGCSVGCGTAGEPELAALAETLAGAGKEVVGRMMVDFLCNKALVGVRLGRRLDDVRRADALLVASCGVGVQAAANIVDIRCVPALDTVSLEGHQGTWPSKERCYQCGACSLGLTAGICPLTACAKSLVNGACGGTTAEGKCEVGDGRDCGWLLIYERLKALGRLDDYLTYQDPKDHHNFTIPKELRTTIRWALEVEEPAEAEPAEETSR